jgi:hypothetical protein
MADPGVVKLSGIVEEPNRARKSTDAALYPGAPSSPWIGARHKITGDGMPSRSILCYTFQNRRS